MQFFVGVVVVDCEYCFVDWMCEQLGLFGCGVGEVVCCFGVYWGYFVEFCGCFCIGCIVVGYEGECGNCDFDLCLDCFEQVVCCVVFVG